MHNYKKLFLPDYKNIKVLKVLSNKEIKNIDKGYNLTPLYIFKKKLKNVLILILKKSGLISFFKISMPRSLDSVHSKYEKIAGSYIKDHKNSDKLKFIAINEKNEIIECKGLITNYYAACLKKLYILFKSKSVLEVGAGELTTIDELLGKLKKSKKTPKKIGAIDISLKRLIEGKKFSDKKRRNIKLIARADSSKLPFPDNSFDMVYTANCLEQVPELFSKSIKELVRVSSNLIVIIEPSYEFGSDSSRKNIFKKGYTRINDNHFKKLGLKPIYRNKLELRYYISGTEIIILKKNKIKKNINKSDYICPSSHKNLYRNGSVYSTKNNDTNYKIKNSIPLLCEGDKV